MFVFELLVICGIRPNRGSLMKAISLHIVHSMEAVDAISSPSGNLNCFPS